MKLRFLLLMLFSLVLEAKLCSQCQRPVAALDTIYIKYNSGDSVVKQVVTAYDTIWNAMHTSYTIKPYYNIDICLGDSVVLIANPSFPGAATGYPQNASMCNYTWDWGDGTSETIYGNTRAGHLYSTFYGYNVLLKVIDPTYPSCFNLTYPDIRVRIAANPINNLLQPLQICAGDTLDMSVGYNAASTVLINNIGITRTAVEDNHDTVFIPDGPNCASSNIACYEAPVTFDNFLPGQTVTSASDILSICINMEHTFLGDLGFFIICPNGQSVTLKYNMHLGGADLGQPNTNDNYWNACDSLANPPGIGWTYCWSNQYLTGSRGVISGMMPSPITASNTTSHTGYFQTPNQTGGANETTNLNGFSTLVGCPLNGIWKLRICDDWGADNGYVFGWDLGLQSGLQAGNWNYNVPVDTILWNGSFVESSGANGSNAQIVSHYDSSGAYTYDIHIIDDFGCVWDTNLAVQIRSNYDTTITAEICNGTYSDFGFNADSTGIYIKSLQTSFGCDSIITLNLLVKDLDTFLISEICLGFVYDSNGFNESIAGTYYDTITNINGCDSIIELQLSVNSPYDLQLYDTVCKGEICSMYGFNEYESGTYYQTYTTIKGCDSILTLNLVVNDTFSLIIDAVICNGETYNQFGFNDSTSGTYHLYYTTTQGCDSTITLNLVVNETYDLMIIDSICKGEMYNKYNFLTDSAGTYIHSEKSFFGCDSITTLILSVNEPYNLTVYDTVCQGETYSNYGFNETINGTYYQNYQTIKGCDSTIILHLVVNPVYDIKYEATICEGEIYQQYDFREDTTGIYVKKLQTIRGCDSTITLTLIVNPSYETTINDSTCEGAIYSYYGFTANKPGFYTQNLVTSTGCDSIIHLNLRITDLCGTIYIPNAFTPDERSNILFKPYAQDMFEITFEIYNRYGGLIFESHDQNKGWDGTFEGKPCQQGVYAWRLIYRNIEHPSIIQEKHGTVMLIR